jgi:hypothetical protein
VTLQPTRLAIKTREEPFYLIWPTPQVSADSSKLFGTIEAVLPSLINVYTDIAPHLTLADTKTRNINPA